MNNFSGLSQEPLSFFQLAVIILSVLSVETLINYKRRWTLAAIAVYLMTAIWYLVEPFYAPGNLNRFSSAIVEDAFFQVILFLASFRFFLPFLTSKLCKISSISVTKVSLQPDKILRYLILLWLCILGFGISRLNGDVFAALLPLAGRSGLNMWSRSAAGGAGATGFIVSSASYIYLLVCSMLGVLLSLQKKKSAILLNLAVILISWPYYFLMGARNQLLAVILPSVFCFVLFTTIKMWKKVVIVGGILAVLNQALLLIVANRNDGFESIISTQEFNVGTQQHLGLNMLQELCYINNFFRDGSLKISYGRGYIDELLNIIPRAIWPSKPLIGIEYAHLRGFGNDGASDIGVFATISHGFIGQGIVNFGPYIGPLVVGIIMAFWATLLTILWMQRESDLRKCLLLVCIALTLNLGRDITLLVLWPVVFGYVIVRFIESKSIGQPSITAASRENYFHGHVELNRESK